MEEQTFLERVVHAQNELKAPKGQYNSFGKYKYRNAEDILEAVKPINLKYGLALKLSDEIIEIGTHNYVQATAILSDVKGVDKPIIVTANAREPETRKGMDDSQITGATSSYARKYALNGLYLIDDTKDADSQPPIDDKQEFSELKGAFLNRVQSVANAKNGDPNNTYSYILNKLNATEITPRNIAKANILLDDIEKMEV